jgi:hypothetical protein
MIWAGINRQLTPMYEGPGVSEYQQNTRLPVAGELQRRPGMAPANFSPAGGAALGMVGAFPTSGPYGVVIDSAGTVNGLPVTGPRWGWPQVQPPVKILAAWSIFVDHLTGYTAADVGDTPGTFPGTTYNSPREYIYATGTCPGSMSLSFYSSWAPLPRLCQVDVYVDQRIPANLIASSLLDLTVNSGMAFGVPANSIVIYIQVGQHGAYIFNGASTPGCP